MNFDNSHGADCQRKLICHLGDTNCFLQSKALKFVLVFGFTERRALNLYSYLIPFQRSALENVCFLEEFAFDSFWFCTDSFWLCVSKLNIINYTKPGREIINRGFICSPTPVCTQFGNSSRLEEVCSPVLMRSASFVVMVTATVYRHNNPLTLKGMPDHRTQSQYWRCDHLLLKPGFNPRNLQTRF